MEKLSKDEKALIKKAIKNYKHDVKDLKTINDLKCEFCKMITQDLYVRPSEEQITKYQEYNDKSLHLYEHCTKMTNLFKKLTKEENDIVECIFFREYSIRKTSIVTHYSERSIFNILDKVYNIFSEINK